MEAGHVKPVIQTGASSFSEAMRLGAEVYHTLKGVIKSKYGQVAVVGGLAQGFSLNRPHHRGGYKRYRFK